MTKQTEAQFLVERGYLTVGRLVLYLKHYHPIKSVSYPTLKRCIDRGEFETIQVGGQMRVTKESIDRYTGFGLPQRVHEADPNDLRADSPNVVQIKPKKNKYQIVPPDVSTTPTLNVVENPEETEFVEEIDREDEVKTIEAPTGIRFTIPDVPSTKVSQEKLKRPSDENE